MILICTCHFRPRKKKWLEIHWTNWSIWHFHVKRKYWFHFHPKQRRIRIFVQHYLFVNANIKSWPLVVLRCIHKPSANRIAFVCACAMHNALSKFAIALQLMQMDCIHNYHSIQSNSCWNSFCFVRNELIELSLFINQNKNEMVWSKVGVFHSNPKYESV